MSKTDAAISVFYPCLGFNSFVVGQLEKAIHTASICESLNTDEGTDFDGVANQAYNKAGQLLVVLILLA